MKIVIGILAAVMLMQFTAQARDVRVPTQTRTVCVGDRQKIIQVNQQVNTWGLNGRYSRKRTWTYSRGIANLRFDTDEASIIATCNQPGRQTYHTNFRLNFNNRNQHFLTIHLRCVVCVNKEVRKAGKQINNARNTLRNAPEIGKKRAVKIANKQLQNAKQILLEQLETNRALTQKQRRLLLQTITLIQRLQGIILETGKLGEIETNMLRQILKNLQAIAR